MSNIMLVVLAYFIIAVFSFIILCNTLATKRTITPHCALFLGILWPIGLLAAYIAFVRNR